MESFSVCRCCLSEGPHKELHASYVWFNKKEVYGEMLEECFNIVLSPSPDKKPEGICSLCITSLRSCVAFRHQVLQADKEFLKMIKRNDNPSKSDLKAEDDGVTDDLPASSDMDYPAEDIDNKLVDVKLEPVDSGDESDDYCLADAAKYIGTKVKIEKSEPRRKAQKRSKQKTGEWESKKIKSLVNRLTTSLNSFEVPQLPEVSIKKKRNLKIPIKHETVKDLPAIVFHKVGSKYKQKHNLETILKYSNVIPFKSKSLIGYLCTYCDTKFQDPADLRCHTEKDHKKERLEFKLDSKVKEFVINADITDLTCTLCDRKIDNLNSLREHLDVEHKKVIYKDVTDNILQFKLKKGDVYDCAMCSATYETFKMLKQHMNIHYSNYTCTKCESSFATKRSLSAHLTTHLEGSYKCSHCDKVFSSKPKRQYHEKLKHLGARNIRNCPICNESFRSYYQRNQHMVKIHNTEAKYKCNVCNKTYILKSLLMYHIKKNHLMERNSQCTECGYRFFSNKALKAHMVKHTGERNFSCEVCHKSYARKYTLREHMRIHNNDRRFKCKICEMSFVQKCSLKSHLLSNHGISMAANEIFVS